MQSFYRKHRAEEFRFWQESLMENNPAWFRVHEFLREGLNALLERLAQIDSYGERGVQRLIAGDEGEALEFKWSPRWNHRDECVNNFHEPSDRPIYVERRNEAKFYQRVDNRTPALPVNQAVRHVQTRWGKTT